jgi:hypothetical protein
LVEVVVIFVVVRVVIVVSVLAVCWSFDLFSSGLLFFILEFELSCLFSFVTAAIAPSGFSSLLSFIYFATYSSI